MRESCEQSQQSYDANSLVNEAKTIPVVSHTMNGTIPHNSDDASDDTNDTSPGSCSEEIALEHSFRESVRPLIDLIDNLRNLGLDKELDLPCIAVIGDQSTGKSSILEAISGVQLPRGSDMCTLCPLEMQLKKSSRSWSARLSYKKGDKEVVKSIEKKDDVGSEVRKAQDEVRGTNAISETRLILRVESSTCPDVTMIDLPGIVRSHAGADIQEAIRKMIDDYIKRPSTIILCVIPCTTHIQTNDAIGISKLVDSEQARTIGVLTKPDLMDAGEEKTYIQVLNNKKYKLKLGYVVVRCRNYEENERQTSHQQALQDEEAFFARNSKFRTLSNKVKGTRTLAQKLTVCLVNHIKASLPSLLEEARRKRDLLKEEIEQLGDVLPCGDVEKRRYLQKVLGETSKTIAEAFGDGRRVPGQILRTDKIHIDDEAEQYNTSHLWRQAFRILTDEINSITNSNLNMVKGRLHVSRIQKKIVSYRGTELPKFPSQKVFHDLIRDHIEEYRESVNNCVDEVGSGVGNIAEYFIRRSLDSCPALEQFIQERCHAALSECLKNTRIHVNIELDKELLVFTQDKTYIKELEKHEKELKEDKKSLTSSTVSDLSFQMNVCVEEEEEKHNAESMQRLIKVYLLVANRRLGDTVPMTIRYYLYSAFIQKFTDALNNVLAADEAFSELQEDPEKETRRQECFESLQSLTRCIELIRNQMRQER